MKKQESPKTAPKKTEPKTKTASAAPKNEQKAPAKPSKKAKAAPKPVRRTYADDLKGEAKDLYLRGVSLERIARYLAVPLRTLTNWQTDQRWTDLKNPSAAAAELRQRGYKMAEIAERLGVSEKTVSKILKPRPSAAK